jgi:hypothetical protein
MTSLAKRYSGITLTNQAITNTESLTQDQVENVNFALNKIWGMPKFKAKHFVGNAQITPFAELRQYFVELCSREDLCETLEYDMQRASIESEMAHEKKNRLTDPLEIKMQELEILRSDRLVKKKKNQLHAAYLERKTYIDLIDEFNASPRGKLPDGRLIIDAITEDPEMIEVLEREYWTLRLAKQTAMDMVAFGRAGVGNMDAVAMLGKEQQEEVMNLACDYFVRNEMRTNSLLSNANERFQHGQIGGKLAEQLELDIRLDGENQDVHLIQGGK